MHLIEQLCLILVASCRAISPLQAAEEQHDESQAEARGPHGGILLLIKFSQVINSRNALPGSFFKLILPCHC